MKFNPDNFGKRDDFTWIGRVTYAREEDSSPEHKERIGASPDTEVNQLVIEVEGISVEWVGEFGNVRRYTCDLQNSEGRDQEGRNNKAYYTMSSLCAPVTEEEANKFDLYRARGKHPAVTGLGYDPRPSDFPQKLEGHIFKVAHQTVTFGKDRTTGEPIQRSVLIFKEELPDNYVHEGKISQISYGNRPTSGTEEGETSPRRGDATPPEPSGPADPAVFFAVIDGEGLKMASLLQACQGNPGLNVDPYRSLIATKSGLKALAESDFIEVDDDNLIRVGDVSGVTVEVLEALLKGS